MDYECEYIINPNTPFRYTIEHDANFNIKKITIYNVDLDKQNIVQINKKHNINIHQFKITRISTTYDTVASAWTSNFMNNSMLKEDTDSFANHYVFQTKSANFQPLQNIKANNIQTDNIKKSNQNMEILFRDIKPIIIDQKKMLPNFRSSKTKDVQKSKNYIISISGNSDMSDNDVDYLIKKIIENNLDN